jgi:short-subunit dehydrogenase
MKETALVTGASGGIGEDLARLIAAGGRDLVLLARSTDKLSALAGELTRAHKVAVTVLPADLSLPDAAARVARELADRQITVDILVNNAGFGTSGAFARGDSQELLRMLHVNILALTMLTRELLPAMLERRRGRVLNVASIAAFQPGPFMAGYYATKAYVLSLSEALSVETAGTGVTVTCLCPGPTHTGFQERAGMQKTRVFKVLRVMRSADVAREGYDAMMAGRSIVIPGLMNKITVQSVRVTPRAVVARIVKALNSDR